MKMAGDYFKTPYRCKKLEKYIYEFPARYWGSTGIWLLNVLEGYRIQKCKDILHPGPVTIPNVLRRPGRVARSDNHTTRPLSQSKLELSIYNIIHRKPCAGSDPTSYSVSPGSRTWSFTKRDSMWPFQLPRAHMVGTSPSRSTCHLRLVVDT